MTIKLPWKGTSSSKSGKTEHRGLDSREQQQGGSGVAVTVRDTLDGRSIDSRSWQSRDVRVLDY